MTVEDFGRKNLQKTAGVWNGKTSRESTIEYEMCSVVQRIVNTYLRADFLP